MFSLYCNVQIIKASNYLFKEVTSEFVLCIPHHMQHLSQIQLGLAYEKLRKFPFLVVPKVEKQLILQEAKKIDEAESLGKKLLEALQVLQIIVQDDQAWNQLPLFNIFIDGHGLYTITAGISTTLEKDEKTGIASSDYLRILDYLNNHIRTKSLTISSCYPSGQKLIDSFNLTSKWHNVYLEKIRYPLIMVGSLYGPTSMAWSKPRVNVYEEFPQFYTAQKLYSPQKNKGMTLFSDCFAFLNETPANFEKFSSLFVSTENANVDLPQNYISIKFPYASWFSFVHYKDIVKSISAIDMAAKYRNKPMLIADKIQIILLGANVITSSIVISRDTSDEKVSLPYILPINYHNQNYFFNEIALPHDQSETVQAPIINMFSALIQVEEPIAIVIKKLTTAIKTFDNVVIFTGLPWEGYDDLQTGYAYIDHDGNAFRAHWPSSKWIRRVVSEQPYDAVALKSWIEIIEQSAHATSVTDYSSVDQMLAAKKTKPMPEMVNRVSCNI